jgi:copper chaperone CopZ
VADVRKALTSLPGVRHVDVEYAKQSATIVIEESRFNRAAVLQALQRQGYGGRVVREEPIPSPK